MKTLIHHYNRIINYLNSTIPPWKQILVFFLVTRIILTIIGISSELVLEPYHGKDNVWHYSSVSALDVWGVWDTGWYLGISREGYNGVTIADGNLKNQGSIAFFPLYPLLMFVVGKIFFSNFLAGIIISNVLLIFSAILLYKLILIDYGEDVARRATKYLFIFPTAFILSGVFTESLFLFLALACFYTFRTKRWLLLSLAGFLLALSRSAGVFIVLPLIYESWKYISSTKNKRPIWQMISIFTPILGLLIFMLFNYNLTGDPLAFARIQAGWGRSLQNPIMLLMNNLKSQDILNLVSVYLTLISIFLLTYNIFKIRFSYILFSLILIFVPLSTGLVSMPRYLVPVFPLLLASALTSKKPLQEEMVTIGLCLVQGVMMVFWSNGFSLLQ